MAVDLRVSQRPRCVDWLAAELLELERAGLLDATREYHPPHFHVAVFPEAFEAHRAAAADSARLARAQADSGRAAEHAALLASLPPVPALVAAAPPQPRWGDVLLTLALVLLRV
jgi:hypothetical protein